MPVFTELALTTQPQDLQCPGPLVVIGRRHRLLSAEVLALLPIDRPQVEAMLRELDPEDWGVSVSTFARGRKVVLGLLPERCSRHNSPSRAWAMPALCRQAGGKQDAALLIAPDDPEHALACCLSAARAFPRFSAKSGPSQQRTVKLMVVCEGPLASPMLQPAMDAVRLAGELVDTPTAELNTVTFTERALAVARSVGAKATVIAGEAVVEAGLGGLWSVGKAAVHKPALVVLEHQPAGASRTVAWVGKGIVYDTGGLALKTKEGMPGMKGDMGGAAAVLGAFWAAARSGCPDHLIAVLCLAENAIGPEATRPDDVVRMASGRTVEINNPDAEGRVVLADGLSWLLHHHKPAWVADLATLTGAQLVATGKQVAAIYSNDEGLEWATVAAGRRAGEPVHPLVYIPELLRKELRSPVADMKNSVKDRNNAQSSCAALFIEEHLPPGAPPWVHVDICGPARDDEERGSAFGVGLLLELLRS